MNWPITIQIPGTPESLNFYLGRHWRRKHDQKNRWKKDIFYSLGHAEREAIEAQAKKGKVYLKITQFRRQLLDPDNLLGSVQPIMNALVSLDFLRDDSERFVSLSVEQHVSIADSTSTRIEFRRRKN